MTLTMTHKRSCAEPAVVEWRGHFGDRMLTCTTCGRTMETEAAPEPPTSDQPPGRYRLDCVRCDQPIWLDRPARRVPLCDACKAER